MLLFLLWYIVFVSGACHTQIGTSSCFANVTVSMKIIKLSPWGPMYHSFYFFLSVLAHEVDGGRVPALYFAVYIWEGCHCIHAMHCTLLKRLKSKTFQDCGHLMESLICLGYMGWVKGLCFWEISEGIWTDIAPASINSVTLVSEGWMCTLKTVFQETEYEWH